MDLENLFSKIKNGEIEQIDLRFTNPIGYLNHFTITAKEFNKNFLKDGICFETSSNMAFPLVHKSELILIPDIETAFFDPFAHQRTLVFICDLVDPMKKERFIMDSRSIAKKAETILKSTQIVDDVLFGLDVEFFVFDDVRFAVDSNNSFYCVDSEEGIWNSGRNENPNLNYKIKERGGCLTTPPLDSLNNLRGEMVKILEEVQNSVKSHRHKESCSQCEIDLNNNTLLKSADNFMKFKYVVKNVARRFGKTATFLPKPLLGEKSSGMKVHHTLLKDGKSLFNGANYEGLSELALFYIGGLLKHSGALSAIVAPTTNSYKRFFPDDTPLTLSYSKMNSTSVVKIGDYKDKAEKKKITFRLSDPSCNPYLALSAQVMAGLDGIVNKIKPEKAIENELTFEELKNFKRPPESLESALKELEKDNEFLLRSGIFTEDFLSAYITYKRRREVEEMAMRPHPYEFILYYDI
jgi:glutamine synthetase